MMTGLSDPTRLDLMTETLIEAATRMQVILFTCRDRAFRHPGNRISLTGGGSSAEWYARTHYRSCR